MANRDEFFAELDGLTEKEIEERLLNWDMERLTLAQEYVETRLASARTVQPDEAPEEPKILYDKATQEMTQAIRENGMSAEQYNQLTMVAQSNPDVSTKLQSYMEKKQ